MTREETAPGPETGSMHLHGCGRLVYNDADKILETGGGIMEVKYSPEVRLGTTAFGLLAQATTTLRNVPQLKETKTVEAGWDAVQDDEGRTLYRLTLKDFTGAVFTDFSPDELKIPMHLHFRIHRLWGELLQIRSEQLHQETKVLLAQMYAGQE